MDVSKTSLDYVAAVLIFVADHRFQKCWFDSFTLNLKLLFCWVHVSNAKNKEKEAVEGEDREYWRKIKQRRGRRGQQYM